MMRHSGGCDTLSVETVKVVHIITKMELGGAQQNTLFTVTHLDPSLWQTYLLAGDGGELWEAARACELFYRVPALVREISPLKDISAYFSIIGLLKKIVSQPPVSAPVIVHTHSSKAGIIGRWAARAAGIPVIIHSIHGYGFHDYQHPLVRRFYIGLERLTARITSRFIAVSESNLNKGVHCRIFPPERAQVIRSGIDIAHFQHSAVSRKTMRQRLDMAEDDRLVTMIACLKPQKAPLDFVRACARIYQRVPSARFLLVGDGHLRNSVEAEVRRQGLEGCFGLTGWRSDIAEILHASDVCVLTSLWEGLPRVIPQAMAAGVPVVATRVDGSPEAVREGLSGFLVQPGNVAEIAERTIQVLLDPEKAAAMGREGQKSVAEFDVNTMVRNQERLYAALLKDGCQ